MTHAQAVSAAGRDEATATLAAQLRSLGISVPVEWHEGPAARGKAFGHLLAIDLYDCACEPLASVDAGYRFLEQLSDELKMARQSPPFVFLSDAQRFPDKAGLSGWVPLIESGISLHTLVPSRFATIDVYSCGPVPPAETLAFACRFFRPSHAEANYLARGRRYPS
jgi:S-adenosylmethionine/arginine decarboxylase-like enzyme